MLRYLVVYVNDGAFPYFITDWTLYKERADQGDVIIIDITEFKQYYQGEWKPCDSQ